MFERAKRALLRWLRVPPEPHAPAGSPGSVVVFRAAPNYYRYHLVRWGLRQALALLGFVVFLFMTGVWGADAMIARIERAAERESVRDAETLENVRKVQEVLRKVQSYAGVIEAIEVVGFAFFLVQLPLSWALVRLDYEMRWYIVTDRSLRLREGVWSVREMTLTHANVQNVKIEQGPLERLLGIADLVVQTAGGGGSGGRGRERGGKREPSMHEARLHGIARADEVRDLILARLAQHRDAGLGDVDDLRAAPEAPETVLVAARAALDEARALRRVVDVRT